MQFLHITNPSRRAKAETEPSVRGGGAVSARAWVTAAVCAAAVLCTVAGAMLRMRTVLCEDTKEPRASGYARLEALTLTGDTQLSRAFVPLSAPSEADLLTTTSYSLSVPMYAEAQLRAFAVPAWKGMPYAVHYASGDESICTVDAAGLVSGLSAGETVITATATDASGATVTAQCAVTVEYALPPVEGLALNRAKVKLRMGGTGTNLALASCVPEQYFALLETPVFTSSDEGVCVVDETGHVTAVAPGEADVTAAVFGLTAACHVTVEDRQVSASGGINLLPFSASDILSIGNQTAGRCSWFALRYARTILDGSICAGSGMWQNGVLWSAGGYTNYSAGLSDCLAKLYSELNAGRPVIVHLQNTTVSAAKHANRITTYEYHQTSSGWQVVEYPHIATSSYYGHWVCVVGYDASADPAALKESDFYALDPARVSAGGTLALTRLMDGTIWTSNAPLKIAAW